MASLAFLCRRYQHVVRPHHAPSSVGVTPFSRSVLRRLRSRQHTNINLSPGVRHRLARLLSACQDLLVPGSDSPRDKDEPFRSSSSLPQLVGVSPLVVAPLVHTRRLHTSAARRVSTRFTSAQLPYRRHVIDDVQEERHGKVPEEHFIAEARSHPTGPVPGDVVSVPEETTSTVKAAFVGNLLITILKFSMWLKTGSSAMFSEAMHTLVDVGNQAFLLLGLRQASMAADTNFQYGYGRAAFFWSLVSALGMFWMGSCVSLFHGVSHLVTPMPHISVGWETWAVLGFSFAVDGVVFAKAFKELRSRAREEGSPMFRYLVNMKDPFLLAVLLEDFSGTLGVVLAAMGIGLTQVTGNVVWDSLASIAIGGLLGGVALTLVRTNQRFLMGQSVEKEITSDIQQLILSRPAVERVYEVQSQWLGPASFSYKAEIDFDGSNLAAQLHGSYVNEFFESEDLRKDLPVLLSCYAEDVTRLVEREVKLIEAIIREKYPAAVFIELEPDSYYTFRRKIDDMGDVTLKKYERNIMLQQLNDILEQKVTRDMTTASADAHAFLQGVNPQPSMPAETMVQVLQLMRRRNRHQDLRIITRNVREQGLAAAKAGDAITSSSDDQSAVRLEKVTRRHSRGVSARPSRTPFDTMSHPLMEESPMMSGAQDEPWGRSEEGGEGGGSSR